LAREDYLITGPDWHSADRHQRNQMVAEIAKIDPDRLLNTSVDDLALYFSDKYEIEVPVLDVDIPCKLTAWARCSRRSMLSAMPS
jgi:hypothetical protein